MDATQIIAAHLAALSFSNLPKSAVAAARLNLMDTIGVAIAGATAPGCREVNRMVLDNYACSQARVWGTGRMATSAEAALANGTMAHALDFDDTHDAAVLHAGVSTVPAALAIADQLGGVSGEDLLTAVAAGLDLTCRLGVATELPPVASGWMYTSLYGLFGATAAAAYLLKLDQERIAHALGIAYAQAAGNAQCMPDGSLSKRMQPGFAAQIGVRSAMLAAAGITGTRNTIDGKHGLAKVYLQGKFDRSILLHALGEKYEHENLSYKPYPSCRHTHTAIDVALQLANEHNIDPSQIARIDLSVNEDAFVNVCTPAEVKNNPRAVVDAQFSTPFCVAVALIRREVFITDFSSEALKNSEVLRLAALVVPKIDEAIQRDFGRAVSPAQLTIIMNNGVVYSGLSYEPRGGIGNPMDFDQIASKFRRCTQYAAGQFNVNKEKSLIDMFRNLEQVKDVRMLSSLLA